MAYGRNLKSRGVRIREYWRMRELLIGRGEGQCEIYMTFLLFLEFLGEFGKGRNLFWRAKGFRGQGQLVKGQGV